jgi:hypothetical protein
MCGLNPDNFRNRYTDDVREGKHIANIFLCAPKKAFRAKKYYLPIKEGIFTIVLSHASTGL